MIGQQLGPYRVLEKLGAGGMGEVYKARDTRLDRTVAIKVLPAEISGDPDRRVRFEREARAVAALSHPHICTLYDIGSHDGTTYLVMEHLAGESLAERLLRGPLPLAQALDVAAQIADALDAAHKHGIIHRDLKPGNVMLTTVGAGRSGMTVAKLLDFGLAKLAAHGERPAVAGGASLPTQAAPVTAKGTILGTLQYMAPEQLEGKEADARTDLWALGAILYEMLTGRRAFEGESQVSLIGNIMNTEPAGVATVQPLTPPALDRAVRKCLAKHPDDRWDTAHDVGDELRWVVQTSSAGGAASGVKPPHARWRRIVSAGGLVLVGALAATAASWLLRPSQAAPAPVYSTIPLKTPPVVTAGQLAHIAISPDGRLLVFNEDGLLVRRPLGSFSTLPLEGTRDAQYPVFKPNGSAVTFFAGGRIRRVALTTPAGEGCDLSYLVTVMKFLGSTLRPRLSRDAVKRMAETLHEAANCVRCLRDSDLRSKSRDRGFHYLESVAVDVEELAKAAEGVESLADGRAKRTRDDVVAALVRHVEQMIGKAHDEEVSLIVASAGEIFADRLFGPRHGPRRMLSKATPYRPDPPRDNYGAEAHAHWRARHRKMLEEETELEKWWREEGKGWADGKEPVEGS